jgi:hypothetical protein
MAAFLTRQAKVIPFVILALAGFGEGCSRQPVSPGLVSLSALGTQRGNHFVRAITHFHSPYSFDACDGKGYRAQGDIDLACLHEAKYALCENHIDYTFVTDHSEHVSETDYPVLLLNEEGDTLVQNAGGDNVATQIHCADGFQPVMAPGLEGKLLALGMEAHTSTDVATRQATYGADDAAAQTTLRGVNALVGIPHTESRDTSALIALQPDFIEIYNLHANLDPKIRKKWLHKKPFDKIAKFLNYLADPYNSLHADYIFADIFEMNQVYFDKWNALLAAGAQLATKHYTTGVGGLDSHENIFSQKASDGQRLDAHRRMTRFFNNFVITPTSSIPAIKSAIQAGHVFFVVEGLGTPVNFDFHGLNDGVVNEMGSQEMVVLPGKASFIKLHVPEVYRDFPGMNSDNPPDITAELHFIDAVTGAEKVVGANFGANSEINYPDPPTGYYRAHIFMKPHHLKDYLFNQDHADENYTWIISNPILVTKQ